MFVNSMSKVVVPRGSVIMGLGSDASTRIPGSLTRTYVEKEVVVLRSFFQLVKRIDLDG